MSADRIEQLIEAAVLRQDAAAADEVTSYLMRGGMTLAEIYEEFRKQYPQFQSDEFDAMLELADSCVMNAVDAEVFGDASALTSGFVAAAL